MDPPLWASLLLMVMPAALAITFPFAMIIAVDAIRRHDAASHVERAAALKLGVLAGCFMLTMGGFVGPFASRQFVRVTTPTGWNLPQPRPQQLSTLALLTHPERTTAILPAPQYTRAGEIRRELLSRSVLSAMPAMFVWLRWASLSRPHRQRFRPLPAWAMTAIAVMAFFAAFFGGFQLEMVWALQPGTGLMLPLIAFGAWALLEQRRAARSQEA
jgi:hypothetical protein